MQLPLLLDHKIAESIECLKQNQPTDNPYYGCFSGGKDSCVIKRLAEMANVKVGWNYHPCPDPPELLRFIRNNHSDVVWTKPKKPIASTLSEWGMPGPWYRICCSLAKEAHGKDRDKIVGVRASESPRRARSWEMVGRGIVAPILNWQDEDVWEFIRSENIPYCCLYDEGFTRLGCVGCPLASQPKREIDFARWPKYEHWWMGICMRLWENKADDLGFIERQKMLGFNCWQDHWKAWRGDMREYMTLHNKKDSDQICGDNDLTRYMQ